MTEIEAGYVAQGYKLPDGLTWDAVAQARGDIDPIYVPVVNVAGVACAWGVPMKDDGFLKHP